MRLPLWACAACHSRKLLRLLKETSKQLLTKWDALTCNEPGLCSPRLTSKIGELPSHFDAVVSSEVREACRAASEAGSCVLLRSPRRAPKKKRLNG